MSTEIERFQIRIPEAVLDDLRHRLERTRFPNEIEGAGWSYGTDLAYLKELCGYWRDKFDWREQERRLNRFEHFRTDIDGLGIHFIHARSSRSDALPLVMLHGWPGSVLLFHKVIEPLSDPAAGGGDPSDAFHVVCPSLPGYGFSDAPKGPGFDARAIADVVAKLMARLGYERYGVQGGDWGSLIATQTALVDPAHVCGVHLNMVVALPPPGQTEFTPAEQEALAAAAKFQREETGYSQIQGTKPQTLGYGLNDSPAGLAAWIVEKFRTWSDCDGNVERRFTKDDLLTNVTIYWATQTITSSMRLYYETMKSGLWGATTERVDVPTAGAIFPKEIIRPARGWAERVYNVTRWTEFDRGGHFAALEEPQLLTDDVRAFFRTVR